MKYDIVIAHRVCPTLSKTAIGFADKKSMVAATTASLSAALEGLSVRLIVILDGCAEYEQIFAETFRSSRSVKLEIINTNSIGNQATWGMQLDMLSRVDDAKYVYFSEDDYIYRPYAFRAMLDFIQQDDVDFVTPLDHPDRYNGRLEKPCSSIVRVSDFCHWRNVPSTCLTFLAKAKVVAESKSIMNSFRYSPEEATMWLGLTKSGIFEVCNLFYVAFRHFIMRRKCKFGDIMGLCTWKRQGIKLLTYPRRELFSPLPSLAVHLASCSLPPGATKDLCGILSPQVLEAIKKAEVSTLRQARSSVQ